MITVADAQNANSSLLLGVSATNDPTGVWHLYKFGVGSAGNWADYPSFGFNAL